MDAISSQYGWGDTEILDLYLCRVCQIKDSIFIRQYYEMQNRHKEIEWQVKTVSSFLIATAQGTEEGKKSLQQLLTRISMSDTNGDKTNGSDERSIEDIIENGSVSSALERNGSRNLSELFAV